MKVEAGMEARADQAEVWHEVAERGHEMDASSPTAAMHDIYEVQAIGWPSSAPGSGCARASADRWR
jgi:hypothetical protein